MHAPGSIKTAAGDLLAALKVVARKKSEPITLQLSDDKGALEVSESRYGLRSQEITAQGKWPSQVQVNGTVLRAIIGKFPKDRLLELVAMPDELCIVSENTTIRIPRIDKTGSKGVDRQSIPQDPRHLGPVERPPEPETKRVVLNDTWAFSARVPMPQHRDKKE